jgi:hypothetical protein
MNKLSVIILSVILLATMVTAKTKQNIDYEFWTGNNNQTCYGRIEGSEYYFNGNWTWNYTENTRLRGDFDIELDCATLTCPDIPACPQAPACPTVNVPETVCNCPAIDTTAFQCPACECPACDVSCPSFDYTLMSKSTKEETIKFMFYGAAIGIAAILLSGYFFLKSQGIDLLQGGTQPRQAPGAIVQRADFGGSRKLPPAR